MKNSLNLGFIALLLIVLGCSCPNLKNFKLDEKGTSSPTPYSTPFDANVSTTPTTTTTGKSSITMAKYTQVKNGMAYSDVIKILGEEGNEVSNSEIGKFKTATYKWDGENYSYIILTFQNDKLIYKAQANLK